MEVTSGLWNSTAQDEGGSNLDAASSMIEKKKVFVEEKNVGGPSEEVTMGWCEGNVHVIRVMYVQPARFSH